MKRRAAGLLYVAGVFGSLLMGAQALMAEPLDADRAMPHRCYMCDGGVCWEILCP